MKTRYRVLKGDYMGAIVYPGNDSYGCANDDTRASGIEHGAYSLNESGNPFFTAPKSDVELVVSEPDDL